MERKQKSQQVSTPKQNINSAPQPQMKEDVVLQLQRLVGNQAVMRMIRKGQFGANAQKSLQRKSEESDEAPKSPPGMDAAIKSSGAEIRNASFTDSELGGVLQEPLQVEGNQVKPGQFVSLNSGGISGTFTDWDKYVEATAPFVEKETKGKKSQ